LRSRPSRRVVGGHRVASGHYHLIVERGFFSLSTDPPVLFARPSIDVLFESVAESYDADAVAVMLTGASDDGAAGARAVKAPRSVFVYGLPCLGPDGTCSVRPLIDVVASLGDIMDSLRVQVTLPVREGPATYPVSSSSSDVAIVQATFDLAASEKGLTGSTIDTLTPLSGTVVVEHLTTDAFRATFDMRLETSDHQLFSVAEGRVESDGCEVYVIPAECHPFD
jgi:hypothetical protein